MIDVFQIYIKFLKKQYLKTSYGHTYLNSNFPVLQEIHTSNSLSLVPTDMTWMHSDVSNGLVDFPLARPFFDKSEIKLVC